MTTTQPQITYQEGTLVFSGLSDASMTSLITSSSDLLPRAVKWDERAKEWRSEARAYRDVMLVSQKIGLSFTDKVRQYEKLPLPLKNKIEPRIHQSAALDAWNQAGRLGVVSLPTGAGKTILAMMAIAACGRPTLIIVPTIDLMQQWQQVVSKFFDVPIGLLGGGSHDIGPITISTYDSAAIHAERLGPQFGLLVCDECHHLPAPQYEFIALCSIAPFRLGLSATVERSDGKEERIYDLLGDKVYEGRIEELQANTLAPYQVVNVQVEMTDEERRVYQESRKYYTDFLRRTGIRFDDGNGWMDFVRHSSRSADGRRAMECYLLQKRLAQASQAKLSEVWRILREHADERIIIFTDENTLAYEIGRKFLVPVLTHHTKVKERKHILDGFRDGTVSVITTSKVLNEGVDVPEASIGVVVSGSGAVREHVQRLGRILRHRPGKKATLYEIISRGTSEYYVNERRKQHYAYQANSERTNKPGGNS
jgi:superfamily II DNA or RNA helicase